MPTLNNDHENEERNKIICAGCGKEKSKGTVVCWNCFKYREDITPLKYYEGPFTEWLKTISK